MLPDFGLRHIFIHEKQAFYIRCYINTCQRPSIIFYWAANNMCSWKSVFLFTDCCWHQYAYSPGWIGKRGSALRGAHKLPAKGNMAKNDLSERDLSMRRFLLNNSFRVGILVWWYGKGTQSLKKPVALDSAGRRWVHHLSARAFFLRYLAAIKSSQSLVPLVGMQGSLTFHFSGVPVLYSEHLELCYSLE